MSLQTFRAPLWQSGEAVGLAVPFDVELVFGTGELVAVRGTVNGYPFRGALLPDGGRHVLSVGMELRAGAKAGPGDVVEVVMERDLRAAELARARAQLAAPRKAAAKKPVAKKPVAKKAAAKKPAAKKKPAKKSAAGKRAR